MMIEDEINIINEMINDKNYELALNTLKDMSKSNQNMSSQYIYCVKTAEIYINHLHDFDLALPYLMKSYIDFQRIEGLIVIVKHYMNINRYIIAYSLGLVCLFTDKIDNIGCDNFVYDYERHYVLSQICMEMKRYDEANSHIKKAIDYLKDDQSDYNDRIKDCKNIFEQSAINMR